MFCLRNTSLCGRDLEGARLPLRRATTSVIIESLPAEDYLSKVSRKIFEFLFLYIRHLSFIQTICQHLAPNYATIFNHTAPRQSWMAPSIRCFPVTTLLLPLPPPFPHHAEDYLPRKHDTHTFEPVGCTRMQAPKSSRQTLPHTIIPVQTVVPAPRLTSSFLPSSFFILGARRRCERIQDGSPVDANGEVNLEGTED
jgi:hypothetical protein